MDNLPCALRYLFSGPPFPLRMSPLWLPMFLLFPHDLRPQKMTFFATRQLLYPLMGFLCWIWFSILLSIMELGNFPYFLTSIDMNQKDIYHILSNISDGYSIKILKLSNKQYCQSQWLIIQAVSAVLKETQGNNFCSSCG